MIFEKNYKNMLWDFDRWPDFRPREVAQRSVSWEEGNTPALVDQAFLDKMQKLRDLCGFPLIINSWYRTPAYNAKVSSTGDNGPHTTGRAVDIKIYGDQLYKLLNNAYILDFTGIGVAQKGEYEKRFVHLDDLSDNETEGPRPWVWSY